MNNKTLPPLLPCPFCGSMPEDQDASEYFVTCPSCGIDGPSGLLDGRPGAMKAWNTRAPLAAGDDRRHVICLCPDCTKPKPAVQPVDVGTLTDKIASMLGLTYHCNRVWSAWNVGTMSRDDFEPVDESDTPREIAEEIFKLYTSPQKALTDEQMADVKTMQQAITEMFHAIKNPGWFTNGERAAMSHFLAWSQKGLDAIHRFGTPTTVEKVGM